MTGVPTLETLLVALIVAGFGLRAFRQLLPRTWRRGVNGLRRALGRQPVAVDAGQGCGSEAGGGSAGGCGGCNGCGSATGTGTGTSTRSIPPAEQPIVIERRR